MKLSGLCVFKQIRGRWGVEGGYGELLTIAFPLIISMGALSVQHFVDRMFLTWYSPEAIAAVTPAGIINFALISIFMGTVTYVSTFVAQYSGAERETHIGPSMWQGIYLSFIGGAALLAIAPFSTVLFNMIGHESTVRELEITYFRTLCYGAAPSILSSALSAFYSGRGKTWPVMWINITGTSVNVFLDYSLIFGHFGFPELGIGGAAIATVFSFIVICTIYAVLISRPANQRKYHTLSGWRFDGLLFRRLAYYGFPNGMQLFLNISGFSLFVILIGRKGMEALAATNITFNINTIAFMPMLGLGMAVSILVGQKIGAGIPSKAEACAYSGFHMAFVYTIVAGLLYWLIPEVFLAPYAFGVDTEAFDKIFNKSVVLLRFVALFSLFDAIAIVFSSAIKGAGDTRFVMTAIVILSWILLVIPTYIALVVFGGDMYMGWVFSRP